MATKTARRKTPDVVLDLAEELGRALKKSVNPNGYTPAQRFRWVEFIEADAPEGAVPARVKIRTSLTAAELDQFSQFTGAVDADKLYDLVAPNVVEWNVVYQDEEGVSYDVAPPAEAGAVAFEYVPYSLFWLIFGALRQTPYRRVDPKSSAPQEPTDEP